MPSTRKPRMGAESDQFHIAGGGKDTSDADLFNGGTAEEEFGGGVTAGSDDVPSSSHKTKRSKVKVDREHKKKKGKKDRKAQEDENGYGAANDEVAQTGMQVLASQSEAMESSEGASATIDRSAANGQEREQFEETEEGSKSKDKTKKRKKSKKSMDIHLEASAPVAQMLLPSEPPTQVNITNDKTSKDDSDADFSIHAPPLDSQSEEDVNPAVAEASGTDGAAAEATPLQTRPLKTPKKKKTFLKPKTPLSSASNSKDAAGAWRAVNDDDDNPSRPSSPGDMYEGLTTATTGGKRRLPVDSPEVENDTAQQSAKKKTKSKTKSAMSTPREYKRRSTPTKVKGEKNTARKEPGNSGKFSDEELATLRSELLKHREANNISEFQQNDLLAAPAAGSTKLLYDQLSDALPDRTRISISKICRRRFHNYPKRGKWDKEEDEELLRLYASGANKWKMIGDVMQRHPEDVRDRWRNYLICGENLTKDRWNEEEEYSLREIMKSSLESVAESKRKSLEEDPSSVKWSLPDLSYVDWQEVSRAMNHIRSRLQCMAKWKRIMEAEADFAANVNTGGKDLEVFHKSWRVDEALDLYKEMSKAAKAELVQAVKESGAVRESKVPWGQFQSQELSKHSTMVKKVAWVSLRATIPDNEGIPVQDVCDLLLPKLSDLSDSFGEPTLAEGTRSIRRPRGIEGSDADTSKAKSKSRKTSKKEGKAVTKSKKSRLIDDLSSPNVPHDSQTGSGDAGTGDAGTEDVQAIETSPARKRKRTTKLKTPKTKKVKKSEELVREDDVEPGAEEDSSVADHDMVDISAE